MILITATEKGIRSLEFLETTHFDYLSAESNHHIEQCKKQLHQFFLGMRKSFVLNLDWEGTPFQKRVWALLLQIPYGKTTSYSEIARALGDENAVRAVGTANGKNKIPIIIPCHRVIGANGSLTGYAGGIWRKSWLLDHEMEYSDFTKQLDLFK